METLSQKILQELITDYQIGRKNRKQSYISILPKLSEKRNIIFSCIYLGCETSYEIESMTGICLRTISARICELRNSGYIVEAGTKKSKFGKNNTIYKVANEYLSQEVDKKELQNTIDEFKKVNDNKKTYTIDQVTIALSQQNISEESIKKVCELLNSL